MSNAIPESFDLIRGPGRPRMGKDCRIAVTLMMPPELADKLSQLAHKQDISRSRFVELLAVRSLADSRQDKETDHEF